MSQFSTEGEITHLSFRPKAPIFTIENTHLCDRNPVDNKYLVEHVHCSSLYTQCIVWDMKVMDSWILERMNGVSSIWVEVPNKHEKYYIHVTTNLLYNSVA